MIHAAPLMLVINGDTHVLDNSWVGKILFDRWLLPWPLGGNLNDAVAPAPCRIVVNCCLVSVERTLLGSLMGVPLLQ